MEINRTDVWPQVRATAIQVGRHGSAAGKAAMRIPSSDTGIERAMAAARSVDELDHAIEAAKSVPGIALVPPVAAAASGYDVARAVLRGAAGSKLAAKAHPVLGASELLASRDHMVEGVALLRPDATEVDRQRATSLLDAAISDAESGFAFLGHPAQEGPVRGTLATARHGIQLRQPIDHAAIDAAAKILADSASGSTVAVAPEPIASSPAPSVVPRIAPTGPTPASYPQVRLDLPRLVLPPVPTFGRAR